MVCSVIWLHKSCPINSELADSNVKNFWSKWLFSATLIDLLWPQSNNWNIKYDYFLYAFWLLVTLDKVDQTPLYNGDGC